MAFDMDWLTDFDPTKAAEDAGTGGDFSPIPDGEYELEILSWEMKPIDNDRATGQRLSIQLAVRGSQYENRRIFDSFCTIYKPKPGGDAEKAAKTQQIGRGRFGSLCVAAGIQKSISDLDVLVGKFVRATVATREYNGKKNNEIRGNFKAPTQNQNVKRPTSTGGKSPWS
jgi:hypothetical protein